MNRSKQKGTAAESAVVDYLRANGWPLVERRTLSGTHDKGDIAGLPCVVEVKNEKAMNLASYVDEANVEARNADAPFGVAFHKRRGKGSPGEWYVSMDGATFVALLQLAYDRTVERVS